MSYRVVIEESRKMIEGVVYRGDRVGIGEMIGIMEVHLKGVYGEVYREGVREEEVREIIGREVIGYRERGRVYVGMLEVVDLVAKMARERWEVERLAQIYDDYMAIASYRSYEHFCKYIERDIFGISLWGDTSNCFSGYWYYANRMVLDGKIKFLEKQLPTGYGKSLSDSFMQAYIFGQDIDADILKVCGNDKFTDDCIINVVKIMSSKKYAKIFPYYSQFKCDENLIYSIYSRKDLKFTINGSKKTTNLRIVTKLSDVNGVRAKWLFLDDITQRSDASSIKAHEKDKNAFEHEWFERNYNREDFRIVASGTTYSIFDLLSYLKEQFGGETAVRSTINKYTYISQSNKIVKDGISVFVVVPLLDPDTNRSTYEKKISTESALKKKEDSYEVFMAMDQQQPLAPDDNPFYFSKLQEYESLPKKGEDGRSENCFASLDPKRRGGDWLSMPIFSEINGRFYVVDWLYDKRTMKELIPIIVSKIMQHNVTRMIVERNTEECLANMLKEKLAERGYMSCVFDEIYTTEQKEKRIAMAEGDIKANVVFPKFGLYSRSSDMGKALEDVYGYNYSGKGVKHDDAPDSLALFVKKYVMKKVRPKSQIEIIK